MQSQKKRTRAQVARYSALAVVGSGFLGTFLGLVVGFSVGQQTAAVPDEPQPRVRAVPADAAHPLLKMAVQKMPLKGHPGDDI